jgi:hypothetical protein
MTSKKLEIKQASRGGKSGVENRYRRNKGVVPLKHRREELLFKSCSFFGYA